MKCRVASLCVLAGLVIAACGENSHPTEPVGIEPSFNSVGTTTQCPGFLTGAHDNVEVPPGVSCFILDATIRGNVKALQNSQLIMIDVQVGGNVEGDKAEFVQLNFSSVNGSIIIQEGVGATTNTACGAAITNSVVGEGNIQVAKMTTGCLIIENNRMLKGNIKVEDNNLFVGTLDFRVTNNVGAVSIQVLKNRGPNLKRVQNNQARVIQCFDNDPPFVGGPNAATAQAEGQCF